MRIDILRSKPWVLALLAAVVEGKQLQIKTSSGCWEDAKVDRDIRFSLTEDKYRIKPTPKRTAVVYYAPAYAQGKHVVFQHYGPSADNKIEANVEKCLKSLADSAHDYKAYVEWYVQEETK